MTNSSTHENTSPDPEKGIESQQRPKYHAEDDSYFLTKYYAPCLLKDKEFGKLLKKNDYSYLESEFEEGRKNLSARIALDPGLQIYRRFQWLYTIALLDAQSTLAKDEAQLKDLLQKAPEVNTTGNEDGAVSSDNRVRTKLEVIRANLKNYAELCKEQHQLLNYPEPMRDSLLCRKIMLWHNRRNISNSDELKGKYPSLFHDNDLMALKNEENPTLLGRAIGIFATSTSLLSSARSARSRQENTRFDRSTVQKDEASKAKDPNSNRTINPGKIISLTSLEICETLINMTFVLIFMFAPIATLCFKLHQWSTWKLLGFSMGFGAALCLYLLGATKARGQELLLALASYCGVLIIFLGLSISDPNSKS